MKTRFLLSFWIASAVGLLPSPVNGVEKRPNILLVMVDDMGWTDLGAFGSEIATPNIDGLARRGLMFTDFYVSVSCSPTRSMLLTGNDNHVAGLGTMAEMLAENQKGKPGYEGRLNERVVSLAEVLREGGYHTYMSGKWHLGHAKGTLPFDRGFKVSRKVRRGIRGSQKAPLGSREGAGHCPPKCGVSGAEPLDQAVEES